MTISLQYTPWRELSDMYLSLEKHVSGGKLAIYDPEELRRLHFMLKDFTSFLQLIGRVSSLFVGDGFLSRIQEGHELIKQLIDLASFSSKMKFYSLQVQPDIAKDFVQV